MVQTTKLKLRPVTCVTGAARLDPEATPRTPHHPGRHWGGPLGLAYPRDGGRTGRNPLGPEWAGSVGPCRKASSSTWDRSPAFGGGGGRKCAVGGKVGGTRAASAASYTAAPEQTEREQVRPVLGAETVQVRTRTRTHAHTYTHHTHTRTPPTPTHSHTQAH